MGNFDLVFTELQQLQKELQGIANRLWAIRTDLMAAYRQGHGEKDFLPRRLLTLRRDAQKKFDQLTNQLNEVVLSRFDNPFMAFSSPTDLKTFQAIRRTIRYLRNAFATEHHLGETLVRLQQVLPVNL